MKPLAVDLAIEISSKGRSCGQWAVRKGWRLFLAAGLALSTPAAAEIEFGSEYGFDIQNEVECLALNIYFEARSESEAGQRAVGHVVLNRVADPRFPGWVCEVIRQGGEWPRNRCQFSWWCDGRSDQPRDHATWKQIKNVAYRVYWGYSEDLTDGALWYHADYVKPAWRKIMGEGKTIGRHIFYSNKKNFVVPVTQSGASRVASHQ